MHSDAPTPAPAPFGLWQGPLAFAPPPVLGENIHGYVRRLAIANGHTGVWRFAESIGVIGIGPSGRDGTWEQLQQATGLPSALLEPMRWAVTRNARGSRVRFLGQELARGHVRPNSSQICSSCVKESGIRRDFWCLVMVAACPRHGTQLIDTCSGCGRRFRTTLSGPADACLCGLPFAEMTATPAPVAALHAAKNLAFLLGPAATGEANRSWHLDLPAAFEVTGVFDYLSYLDVLGRVGSMPAAEEIPTSLMSGYHRSANFHEQPDINRILKRLEAADQIIAGWPGSFDVLLDKITEHCRASGGLSTLTSAYSTTAGKLLLHPPRGMNRLPLRLIFEAVDDHWRRRGGRTRGYTLTVVNATTRALRTHFHPVWLAQAVGSGVNSLHRRVVNRILDSVTDVEQTIPENVLIPLVREYQATSENHPLATLRIQPLMLI